jgi:hypothetical protein
MSSEAPAEMSPQNSCSATRLHSLYGRRNTLVDAWDRPLAEIVEILPP